MNIMNIRKDIDYSEMYTGINQAIAAALSQMELYLELGRLVSGRPEKGAAVMAAEYISANYPDQTGFSPRNLRRMRDIYRPYEGHPEMLEQTVKIGWTQNLTIMETDLDLDARYWYLLAVQRFGWSKAELIKQIAAEAHLENTIEEESQDHEDTDALGKCYGVRNIISQIVAQAVDFLDGLWYNRPWKIYLFQQKGIMSDAYGQKNNIRKAVKKSECDHWITNIENIAATICSELDSAVVEAVFRRYGAHSAKDANPNDLPEIFGELYAIEADLK